MYKQNVIVHSKMYTLPSSSLKNVILYLKLVSWYKKVLFGNSMAINDEKVHPHTFSYQRLQLLEVSFPLVT